MSDTGLGGQARAVRVVRGSPSPEELAALVVVLSARSGGSDDHGQLTRSTWANPLRAAGADLRAGPGAWRSSSLPR